MTDKSNTKTAGYDSIRRFLHINKKIILNILAGILFLYTIFLLVRICTASFGNVSIPNEYREAANIQLTKAFMDGINPYRMSAYDGEIPGMIYVYGPLYSLFTAFLGKLLPIDIIALHYIVTLFSVVISAELSAYMVYKRTKYLAAPAATFLFSINCSWRYGYINAVPDAFAFMIFVIIIFLMSLEIREGAGASRKRFIRDTVCAILSVSLFFVKQYFLLIVAAVFLFKFINDKKDGIRFFIITAAVAVIVAALVSLTCPLYWTYSIFLAHGPFGITQEQYHNAYGSYMEENIAPEKNEKIKEEIEEDAAPGKNEEIKENIKEEVKEDAAPEKKNETEKEEITEKDEAFTVESVNTDPKSGFGYEILQLKSLAGMFIFIFAAVLWGVISEISGGFKKKQDFVFFLLILMVISFCALIYLGRNDGAWLSYYLQLLMPEVIIYAFIFTDAMICSDKRSAGMAAFVLLCFMMFFTAYRTNGRLKIYDKTKEQLSDWNRAYSLAAEYASKGEVCYVPVLGFQTIYNGQELYNNGHSMVITGWFRGEYFAVGWEQKVFPLAGNVLQRHFDYQQKIKEKAAHKEYDLVTIIPGMDTDLGRLNCNDLKTYGYRKIDSILLNTGRLSYEVQFWAP